MFKYLHFAVYLSLLACLFLPINSLLAAAQLQANDDERFKAASFIILPNSPTGLMMPTSKMNL